MKRRTCLTKMIAILLSGSMLFGSCVSTTMIQTNPTGAKLYVDGEPVGTTPYSYSDTKIVGSSTAVKLEKEGYQPFQTYFNRNEEVDIGAVIGGFLVLVPFLWTMKYKPSHTYELTPLVGEQQLPTIINQQQNIIPGSKVDRLRELKKLLDEKIISQEEFNKEKQKILDEK